MFENDPGFAYLCVILALFVIAAGIVWPLFIMNNMSTIHFKNLSDAMDKQISAQVSHYEAVVRMHEDLQRFRHDHNNLYLGLRSLLMQHDINGALNYLESDEMTLYNNLNTFDTGNVVLDALLTDKQYTADSINTTIVFDGELPENLLSTADICIIFGNALDNAIEACANQSALEGKLITVKASFSNNFLFIEIKNPVNKDIRIINNSITTTKEDKQSRGIGLRSIQTVAAKYSGKMTLSCCENLFCIEIDLDLHGLK